MKKTVLMFAVLILVGCRSGNDRIKRMAEEKYAGYEKTIKDKDAIPEIVPGNEGVITIRVPSDLDKVGINLDEVMDSMYYIRLETHPDALIGDVDKLLFCDSIIVVVEHIKRQSILLFSRQGKFLRRVGVQGNGPGEYINFTDVAIDHEKKNIIVLDDRGGKLMYYEMNGKHIKDMRLIYFVRNIAVLEDGNFLIGQHRDLNFHLPSVSDYMLLFAEPDLNIIGKSLSHAYRDKFPGIEYSNPDFNVDKDVVWFNPLFTDTIYKVTGKNTIRAEYCIDMGNKNITRRLNEQTTSNDVLTMLNARKYLSFWGKSFETDNYLYFEVSYNQCYYSKQKDKLCYGNFWQYRDEGIAERLVSYNPPVTADGHFFVAVLQPYSFLPNLKFQKLSPDIDSIFADIKVDDNPVLFFYSFK